MASKALKLAVALLTCVSVGLPPSLAEARPAGAIGAPAGTAVTARAGAVAPPLLRVVLPRVSGILWGLPPPLLRQVLPGELLRRSRLLPATLNSGAAFAAGLIEGMALGAILASASRQRVYRTRYYAPRYYRR